MKKLFSIFAAVLMAASMMAETVYYVNTNKWAAVKVHAWGGKKAGTTWPGLDATKEADIKGWEVYSFTAEAGDYNMCIFNNGNGQQTSDLVWTAGKYYFNGAWVTAEEITETLAPVGEETIYFVNTNKWETVSVHAWGGTAAATNWPGVNATKEADIKGWEVYSFTAKAGAYGQCLFNNGDGSEKTADLVWTADKYYFNGAWVTAEEITESIVAINYYINGSTEYFGDWNANNFIGMPNDEIVINATPGVYTFRVFDAPYWAAGSLGYDDLDVENSSANVKAAGDADDNIQINLVDGAVTIKVVEGKVQVIGNFAGEIEITSMTICGVAALCGVAWAPTATENDMTTEDNIVWTLTKEGVKLEAGDYNYKAAANHAWSIFELPGGGDASNILTITETGTYDITFTANIEEKTLTAEAVKQTETALSNTTSAAVATKALIRGELVIVKDGVRYNVMGIRK